MFDGFFLVYFLSLILSRWGITETEVLSSTGSDLFFRTVIVVAESLQMEESTDNRILYPYWSFVAPQPPLRGYTWKGKCRLVFICKSTSSRSVLRIKQYRTTPLCVHSVILWLFSFVCFISLLFILNMVSKSCSICPKSEYTSPRFNIEKNTRSFYYHCPLFIP